MQNKGDTEKQLGILASARLCPSPNFDERPCEEDINLIVIHNISLPPGKYGEDWIDKLFTNQLPENAHPFFAEIYELRVSSHILIRRDGEIVQYVPFHKRAWHAGLSNFRGREVCNDFSIGIELEGTDFEAFTDIQYIQLQDVIKHLREEYPSLDNGCVTGHEHIAPKRKTDPGPFFDWKRLSASLGEELPANACDNNETQTYPETIIDFLRHGEPVGGKMYRGGETDHPLSDEGWQQMWDSVEPHVESLAWDMVVSSPMSRCADFSEALCEKYQLPLEVREGFREAGYGAWEGMTPAEIEAKDSDGYWAFFSDPVNSRPENSEPILEFSEKIKMEFAQLLAEYEGKHVLLVSHLGVARSLVANILAAPLAGQQLIDLPFAGMLRIINDRKGLRILFR